VRYLRNRRGKTGQWLLKSKEFQGWRDGPPETHFGVMNFVDPFANQCQLVSLTGYITAGAGDRLSFRESLVFHKAQTRISDHAASRSIVIEDLETFFKNQQVAILCICFNYKEQSQQTVLSLVARPLESN